MLLITSEHILGQQQIVIPPDGGTVTLQPGVYIGPDIIPTNTHIVGQGALIGDELIANGGISAQQTGSIKTVRILYSHPLVIDRSTAIEMSGVILDFQNTGGLTLDSVSESHFDIGIQHSGESPALTMAANHGNNVGNTFGHLIIWDCNGGAFYSKAGGKQGRSRGMTSTTYKSCIVPTTASTFRCSRIRTFSIQSAFHRLNATA